MSDNIIGAFTRFNTEQATEITVSLTMCYSFFIYLTIESYKTQEKRNNGNNVVQSTPSQCPFFFIHGLHDARWCKRRKWEVQIKHLVSDIEKRKKQYAVMRLIKHVQLFGMISEERSDCRQRKINTKIRLRRTCSTCYHARTRLIHTHTHTESHPPTQRHSNSWYFSYKTENNSNRKFKTIAIYRKIISTFKHPFA